MRHATDHPPIKKKKKKVCVCKHVVVVLKQGEKKKIQKMTKYTEGCLFLFFRHIQTERMYKKTKKPCLIEAHITVKKFIHRFMYVLIYIHIYTHTHTISLFFFLSSHYFSNCHLYVPGKSGLIH